jgi:hypothetical protein
MSLSDAVKGCISLSKIQNTANFFCRLVEKLCCLVLEALTHDLTGHETDNESDSDITLRERGCRGLLRPTSLPDGYGSNGLCRLSGPGLIDRIPAALVEAVTPLLPGPPCDWTAWPLPVDCILDRILRIQKLEQTGSDRVYEAYRTWTRMHHLRGGNVAMNDYSYVAGMLSAGTGARPGLSPLHCYLLATTAKDCSIMLSFQRLPDHDCRYTLYFHYFMLCALALLYSFCLLVS